MSSGVINSNDIAYAQPLFLSNSYLIIPEGEIDENSPKQQQYHQLLAPLYRILRTLSLMQATDTSDHQTTLRVSTSGLTLGRDHVKWQIGNMNEQLDQLQTAEVVDDVQERFARLQTQQYENELLLALASPYLYMDIPVNRFCTVERVYTFVDKATPKVELRAWCDIPLATGRATPMVFADPIVSSQARDDSNQPQHVSEQDKPNSLSLAEFPEGNPTPPPIPNNPRYIMNGDMLFHEIVTEANTIVDLVEKTTEIAATIQHCYADDSRQDGEPMKMTDDDDDEMQPLSPDESQAIDDGDLSRFLFQSLSSSVEHMVHQITRFLHFSRLARRGFSRASLLSLHLAKSLHTVLSPLIPATCGVIPIPETSQWVLQLFTRSLDRRNAPINVPLPTTPRGTYHISSKRVIQTIMSSNYTNFLRFLGFALDYQFLMVGFRFLVQPHIEVRVYKLCRVDSSSSPHSLFGKGVTPQASQAYPSQHSNTTLNNAALNITYVPNARWILDIRALTTESNVESSSGDISQLLDILNAQVYPDSMNATV